MIAFLRKSSYVLALAAAAWLAGKLAAYLAASCSLVGWLAGCCCLPGRHPIGTLFATLLGSRRVDRNAICYTSAVPPLNRDAMCDTFAFSGAKSGVFLWDSDRKIDSFLDSPRKSSLGAMVFSEHRTSQRSS